VLVVNVISSVLTHFHRDLTHLFVRMTLYFLSFDSHDGESDPHSI